MKRFNLVKIFFRDMQLKYKLILSFLVLIIVPLVVQNVVTFGKISQVLEERIIFSASQVFAQTTDFVTYKINKIIDISEQIAVNESVKSMLEKPLTDYPLEEQYEDIDKMRGYLSSFRNVEDIYNVCLYVRDEVAHADVDGDIASFSSARNTQWYRQLPGADGNVFMVPPEYYQPRVGETNKQNVLSVVRRISGTDNYLDTIGYLRIDFLESKIKNILSNANSIDGSFTYIQNRDYRIVITTEDEMIEKYRISMSLMDSISKANDWTVTNLSGEKVYVRSQKIDRTDWTVITVIPAAYVFREIIEINNFMTVFLSVIAVIAVALSIFIAVNIAKRLHHLSQKMTMVTENVFEEYTDEKDSKDEIGELAESYNYMVGRISKMAKEQYQSGQELKTAELKALQAQINPHFLYNTLDMINWMSYEDKGAEIRKIIKALSTFYKLSLSKGNSVISIRDELYHVSLYMSIQNYRLQNAIDFTIECPEYLKDYSIPKITLQPIVENAILHGIQGRENKRGSISISVTEQDEYIYIYTHDDGVGIPADRLDAILDHESTKGFGLKNINTRMMLSFNYLSGISIESEVGVGTTVIVKILKKIQE
ncbi:two-component system sensor histidine kinase YesM [Hydrogenoanaerobacterium saccharovorans]|uniref:histidine kinase n=1 Tax=Hydrogenoanaerobacterium saccharovorans TaxID=474960 RepID=A0A1H8DRZ0_9FIRM|nr:sensor histidine kinase [Hydrogenoanaerobacterium saccharovorans]RPF42328.1 two-component system sensor histidine kinase YesM [Hydrogenoanaerobacterium saccharovorans]SEN09307.1 two-component system, sensor histidine kinase YesM [Hydrogenoanaerobacterium saccharovorans]